MTERRLIEEWLPIGALGEESVRERRSMTALPPTYYLHVWWARRPLVASRAAVLASLLPADADHDKFLHAIGIHGDPVAARIEIDRARRTGIRVDDPYGYTRAFSYTPNNQDRAWLGQTGYVLNQTVLDPTAGGGSIPFESVRLGLPTTANDLNPVASLLLLATVKWPAIFGTPLLSEFKGIAKSWRDRVASRLDGVYPCGGPPQEVDATYLFARTITCPYCDGLIPLSPNWRLSPTGIEVRLLPDKAAGPLTPGRICHFEIVDKHGIHSEGTVSDGDATCPFPDCARVVDGNEVKRQAQAGGMGDQLYAVVFRRKVITGKTKSGKEKIKWVRGFRAPRRDDNNTAAIADLLSSRLPEWEANDMVPTEVLPEGNKTTEPIRYGMTAWRDLFSPRQLLCHATCVEVYRELLEADRAAGALSDLRKAAYVYLALSLDKLRDYNSRMTRWHSNREVIAGTFDRHDFALKWSYVEMAPLIDGLGCDWAVEQTAKCIKELIELVRPDEAAVAKVALDAAKRSAKGAELFSKPPAAPDGPYEPPPIAISCNSGDHLDHIEENSIDVVVMDPPYYDNVMYAELSDFFYVWLKRTAGYVEPSLFRRQLTDKDHEAVANVARFKGQKSAKALAGRDYQDRMAAIFAECRRVLKPDGVLTLMFTHKATGAWDALTTGLMKAGFTITASWPINTEAEGSLHIKDKSAANSTIFLACRPRQKQSAVKEKIYWEDVEPLVAKAVRERVQKFQDAGITGVDLYLASFGPALEKFSEFWPLERGTPRPQADLEKKRKKQADLFPEEIDPYAVTPEDALTAARREVKNWRLEQLTHRKARTDMDPVTAWFVLAWDAFEAPVFPYDEALRLARAVGVDLEKDIVGRLATKKTSDIVLLDSQQRAAKMYLGPADGSRTMLDVLHHAAHAARTRSLEAARELLEKGNWVNEPAFHVALQAVLEVLPVSATFSKIELTPALSGFGSDFEALENLRRLAFTEQVDEPTLLSKLREEEAIQLQ